MLDEKVARRGDALACGALMERLCWQLARSLVAVYVGALALGVVDQANRPPPTGGLRLEHDGELEIVRSSPIADEDPALG